MRNKYTNDLYNAYCEIELVQFESLLRKGYSKVENFLLEKSRRKFQHPSLLIYDLIFRTFVA